MIILSTKTQKRQGCVCLQCVGFHCSNKQPASDKGMSLSSMLEGHFHIKVQLSTIEIKITKAERNHFICLPKPLHPQPNDKLIRFDYAREALKLLVVVNRWQDWKNWVLYIPVYGGAIPTIQVKGFKIIQEQSIWLHIFHCNSCNTNSMRCLPVARVAAIWINLKALITHVKCIWRHGEDVTRKWLWWKLAKSEKRSLNFEFCRYKVTPSVLCFSSLTFHFPSVQLQSICAKSFRKRQLGGWKLLILLYFDKLIKQSCGSPALLKLCISEDYRSIDLTTYRNL